MKPNRSQTSDQVIRAIQTWLEADEPCLDSPGDQREQERELDWQHLEAEAKWFKERYGAAAMLRCVSESLR
jgi:hypothetical protein